MTRLKKSVPFIVAAVVALAAGTAFAGLHHSRHSSAEHMTKKISLRGAVASIDAQHNSVTISWRTARKGLLHRSRVRRETVLVSPSTDITFEGGTLKLSQIKMGSSVEVTAEKTGRRLMASQIKVLAQPTAHGGLSGGKGQ